MGVSFLVMFFKVQITFNPSCPPGLTDIECQCYLIRLFCCPPPTYDDDSYGPGLVSYQPPPMISCLDVTVECGDCSDDFPAAVGELEEISDVDNDDIG